MPTLLRGFDSLLPLQVMTERHCRCLVTSIHLGLQGLVLAVVNITGGQVKRVHVGLPVLKVYRGLEK